MVKLAETLIHPDRAIGEASRHVPLLDEWRGR